MRADLLDISHHNSITSWDDVPVVPIVHKVNEGSARDRRVAERMPEISQRTVLFGGYTVLIVSRSTIRQQIEQYADFMERFWRPGAFTQLDCEPWPGRYSRPVNAEEILEAAEVHDEVLGKNRVSLYINPRQMPGVLEQVRQHRDIPLWEPHYGRGGSRSAVDNQATLHQWTSTYPCPGFTGGIDANEILRPDVLISIAGLDEPEPPTTSKEDDMSILWKPEGYANLFWITAGGATHISGEVRDAILAANPDTPKVVGDGHKGMLSNVLRQTGLTEHDLTPVLPTTE